MWLIPSLISAQASRSTIAETLHVATGPAMPRSESQDEGPGMGMQLETCDVTHMWYACKLKEMLKRGNHVQVLCFS